MTAATFDAADHAALADIGVRLRELAGEAAYRAGREYQRKGLVKETSVAGTIAYATVSGSTDYRVSVAFPSVEGEKVTCTCPAHRRSKYCKHVVAVCATLLEQPSSFAVLEAAPVPSAAEKPAGSTKRKRAVAKPDPTELRVAGLETVDRLLAELADGGLTTLGSEKAALVAQAAELVRALKLRRLGNLLMQLQRAAADPKAVDEASFVRLLQDLALTRQATGTSTNGGAGVDPRLAEDLVGKTWRAEDLEPVTGLELVEVGATYVNDGEFAIETGYLVDLGSGALCAERQITPNRLRGRPRPRQRVRLLVDEAGLYPGIPPRRIRLSRVRRAPLRQEDVARVVDRAIYSVAKLRRRLVERVDEPFGGAEVPVLFRPSRMVREGERIGAFGRDGGFFDVQWGGVRGRQDPLALVPRSGGYALFGLLTPGPERLNLRWLSLVGAESRRTLSPIYPE